jgi:hypothetical protein
MGLPAMVRRTLRARRVEARRAGMTPMTMAGRFSPGWEWSCESSMMGLGCAVARLFLEENFCAGVPLTHIGGVAQMVRASDS